LVSGEGDFMEILFAESKTILPQRRKKLMVIRRDFRDFIVVG
jgi:hypothetical protein